jgi:membrane protease YdiL (CAAX protease family)
MYLTLSVSVVCVIVLANYADLHRGLQPVVYALLGLGDLLLCGIGAVTLSSAWLPWLGPNAGWGVALGGLMFSTGLLGMATLLPRVRQGVSRVLDIRADSSVHTTCLNLTLCAVGLGVAQALVWRSLDQVPLQIIAVTPLDLVASSALMLVLAVTGVGLLVRRTFAQTVSRLGLRRLRVPDLLVAVLTAGLFLALDAATSRLWQVINPPSFQRAQETATSLFSAILTPAGALTAGLAAGIGEELLFRGALQPRLGLVLTSLLFMLAHFQYSFSLGMVEVLLLGLALGYLRRRAGTTPCILVHGGYNIANVVMLMVAA